MVKLTITDGFHLNSYTIDSMADGYWSGVGYNSMV